MNREKLLKDLNVIYNMEVKCQDSTHIPQFIKGYKKGVLNTYELIIALIELSEGKEGILWVIY